MRELVYQGLGEVEDQRVSDLEEFMESDMDYWTNRTICDVLEEMRRCCKTLNFASLLGLIEEAQAMANRVEAGLGNKKDLDKMASEWHIKRKEIKGLNKEIASLESKKKSLSGRGVKFKIVNK